jgi:energy-coupling factor transporter transmembrane protein EcfT
LTASVDGPDLPGAGAPGPVIPVTRPHPSSLILLAAAALSAAASRDGVSLYLACAGLVLAAMAAAPSDLHLLVRRSRWLLLTILLMFGWLTPGTPLAAIPGTTLEGLLLAADYIARLLVALATLALLLRSLDPPQLVAGMRAMLAPIELLGFSRDRIAVRLALTLQEVEAARNGGDGERESGATCLVLPCHVPGTADLLLGVVSAALVLAALLA